MQYENSDYVSTNAANAPTKKHALPTGSACLSYISKASHLHSDPTLNLKHETLNACSLTNLKFHPSILRSSFFGGIVSNRLVLSKTNSR